ncbi:MAG: sulfotransferase [Pelagimonas sp.]|jgi:hypothetical protein|nr:sulfotransferase [Pelagimonas sp.]
MSAAQQTLPHFLIIGAMKAGTTTLYEDLTRVPGLYLPPEKEPEDLIHPEVETDAGRAAYAAKFAGAPKGALCGEASTAYTKLPTHSGVAERALRVLGPEVKLIYLTRDPIRRIRSQYHHLWGLGIEQRPMNRAVLEDETYVAYSQYARQLAPWRANFDEAQVLVMAFEEYLADRPAALTQICAFLGVDAPASVADSHRNASDGKRVIPRGSVLARIAASDVYLYRIKPLMPTGLRDRIKALLLPKARKMQDTLHPETVKTLTDRLSQK